MTSRIPFSPPPGKQDQFLHFAIINKAHTQNMEPYIQDITELLQAQGHQLTTEDRGVNFVIHLVDLKDPEPYHRTRPDEFVITFAMLPVGTIDIRATCYVALLKTLSNLFFGILPTEGSHAPKIFHVTPEAGVIQFPFDPAGVVKRMEPVIRAHLVLKNRFMVDLPAESAENFTEVKEYIQFGNKLRQLGVRPTPSSINQLLSSDRMKKTYQFYQGKHLTCGNYSIRAKTPYDDSFWMTARHADKSQINKIGKDILLVSGFAPVSQHLLVSVPPNYDTTARTSVDAFEHYWIYKNLPDVGAIVHLHAWMDNIPLIDKNYPCGSQELAYEVVNLLKKCENPSKAAIGIKNHGITITGESLEEIFSRIEGRLRFQAPIM